MISTKKNKPIFKMGLFSNQKQRMKNLLWTTFIYEGYPTKNTFSRRNDRL